MRESELLQHIYDANGELCADVVIPPGDDMGAVRLGGAMLLVTVDQVADGVHFDLARHSLTGIGRKAITRNLSDVAAMAAKPLAAVAAASLPRDFGQDRAEQLFDIMRQTAAAYGCPLIGGDISIWSGKLLLSVTVFAEPAGERPVLRSGAKVGDGIYVSGQLGGSLPSGHHISFEPRLDIARTLGATPALRPNCMIDLSDGLGCDLPRICQASKVAAIIEAEKLPIRTNCDWKNAVGDGEDYELLFTSDKLTPGSIDGITITRIGQIVQHDQGPLATIRFEDGRVLDLSEHGWEHHS